MIYLKIKVDNLFMFSNTTVDLTYQKKIKNPSVEFEYLEGFEKIKYKRVVIISGGNASGKTKLGRVFNFINIFTAGRNNTDISKSIRDKSKTASFYAEFVTPESGLLHSIEAHFDVDGVVAETYRKTKLLKSFNYETMISRLNNETIEFFYNRNSENHKIESPGFKSVASTFGTLKIAAGWYYSYAEKGSKANTVDSADVDLDFMAKFLKVFDSSISKLTNIPGDKSKHEFRIHFKNEDSVIVSDGELKESTNSRLSRGSIEAIELAYFCLWVKLNDSSTYYLDEKMAYSHTEMEQAILNWVITNLPRNSQLFYTTHNHDILSMNLPTHSYIFLRKNKFTEVIHPEKLGFTKNDRNLLGYVENDVFGTLPDTDALLELNG